MISQFKPLGAQLALVAAMVSWASAASAQAVEASAPTVAPKEAVAAKAPDAAASVPLSSAAQQLYGQARHQLVQVRTLLKGQGSQSTVGSGFFVGQEGWIVTNYHVVSQVALQPDRYRLTFVGADGQQGDLELLVFDAIHDLAVVRPVKALGQAMTGLALRPRGEAPAKGERIYSLGNPLDVGFAVVEGTYNGLVERSFYPSIFFSGSLNAGMSGGPALDAQGRVMGINVATRMDGQQVSFLVPSDFAGDLLNKAKAAKPITSPAYPLITQQLLAHQETLTRRFMAQPWRSAGHARYRIPVPQEVFMRCWGASSSALQKALLFERSDCSMNQAVFISSGFQTGSLSERHEIYDGRKLGAWRFARQYARSFRNESFTGGRQRTTAQCRERFIEQQGLPMRAVLCLSAYKKLPGLYDLGVLVASLKEDTGGMQARFDASGVSYDNAMKLAEFYLKGFGWTQDSGTKPAALPSR
jgi:serine protease Do